MRGFMNFLLRLFIITAVPLAFAGCAPPVGTLYNGGGLSGHDTIWAQPNRIVYLVDNYFRPHDDLQVFASYRGIVEAIPLNRVTIEIDDLSNPDMSGVVDSFYQLSTPGRKIIIITYENKTYQYSIQVQDPFGGSGPGNGNGGGGGIIIIWKPPPP